MVIIQDQDDICVLFYEVLQEGHQDGCERRRLGRVQHGESPLPTIRLIDLQCRNDRGPKAYRIIIQLIKGKPGNQWFGSVSLCALHPFQALIWPQRESHPCGEQCGLPTTSRGRDERQRMRARCI